MTPNNQDELDELVLEYSASRIIFAEEEEEEEEARLVVSLRDVTEREHAAAVLQASEARFRATFEQAAMGMSIASLNGHFLRVNERFCRITGYSSEEMLARTFQQITHPDDLDLDLQHVRRLTTGEIGTYTLEKRYVRKDGTPVWVELTASLVRQNDGAPDYFIALVEDITPRRNLETQLRQTQKMEAVGQLAGGVAHDFNNMLTTIQGHVTLMGMAATLPAPTRESLDEIMSAAKRAASLTRQLLLFSRREVMQPARLNLNDTVTSIAKMLQRLIGEDVRMRLQLHPRPLPVHADTGMIDQVLMNLAVNARDAMPRGGDLIIETAEKVVDVEIARLNPEAAPGRYVCLSVSDTGSGIPVEVLPRIFEPFFTTKEVGKGTGLGLATVFGIVKQHRGWAKVYSEVGRGTTFRVFLPLVTATDAPAQIAESPPTPPHGEGETVLLVEDDTSVRTMTEITLERSGYRVLSAATGDDALREWDRHTGQVELLLTDLVMPGSVNGIELAAQLQTRQPNLKVIFVSGYSAEIAGRALNLRGGQIFLQKPFEISRLLTMISELLHPSERSGD
jgi:PAS domain S-box-containing protein